MYIPKSLTVIILGLLFYTPACNFQENQDIEIYNEFKGEKKWDPNTFSPIPEEAPFDLSLRLEQKIINETRMLNMQLLLHNPTKDSIYLSTPAGSKPYFDFVVTKQDSMRVWNRLQSNVRVMVQSMIGLKPGETKHFQHYWNYKNYEGKSIKNGKFLVYGGVEMLHLMDESFNEVLKDYGTVGVGPDTLIIK